MTASTDGTILRVGDITSYLDSAIPLELQESYDNAGLQVGRPGNKISSLLFALDVTEEVVTEAVAKGCGLIVTHHPLIFGGLKSITGKNPVERIIIKAVNENMAIYSAHTNLDFFNAGVSRALAEKLGLKNIRLLLPSKGTLLKLVTYVPESHFEKVRAAVFDAGAGNIGNYDRCGFSVSGHGTFRGNDDSNPFTGNKGEEHTEAEIRFETIMYRHQQSRVVKALIEAHPYEEPAFDIFAQEAGNTGIGLGCTGDLNVAMSETDFLAHVRDTLDAQGIRYSKLTGKAISKVAVCGGAGISLLKNAINTGADAFVTADLKYHNFFDADGRLLLVDAGHYETEKYSTGVLYTLINKKFPNFALRFSETNTNPINYL